MRAVAGAAMAGTLVLACNLLTGAGDLEIPTDDTSNGMPTGKDSGPAAEGGAAADGSSVADAKPPVDTGPPPTCPSSGHSCVKGPPAGWEGPWLVYVGPESGAPSCPIELPDNLDVPTGDPDSAFDCECKCGGVNGATCGAFLQGYNDGACTPPVGSADLPLDTCQSPDGDVGFKANLALTADGSCGAFAAFKDKAAPAFGTMLRACGRPTAFATDGCASDELCVPDGKPPFLAHTCIFSEDPDAVCPAPWTESHRTYEDVDDTRDCGKGTCDCGTPTGITCQGSIRNYTTTKTCNGTSDVIALPANGNPTACVAVAATTSQKVIAGSLRANGGSCAASGVPVASGGVAGVGGAKICCMP
ncbi:MAG: hypothetical protein U0270_44280 [Labilithrix sp.]